MICPNCGKNNPETEAYCVNCGAALIRATAQKSVQKAVEAYRRPANKQENKNLLPTVIIIFLSLILVIAIVLLAPKLIAMLQAPDAEDSGNKNTGSLQSAVADDFTTNPYYECYRNHPSYVLPNSSSAYLNREDLKELTAEELDIALYEISARHGERFRDTDLQEYFDNRSWYSSSNPNSNYNTYETANQVLLEVYIGQQEGAFTQPGNDYLDLFPGKDTYALEESTKEYLEAEELKELDEDELAIARSEIYARHGYVFSDRYLQAYFCTKEWYVPSTSAVSESSFNEYEANNLQLLKLYEQKLEGATYSPDNPFLDYYSSSDSYILEYSDTRELLDSDLKDFDENQCILARNEIYARHGYVPTDEDLLGYFLLQEWYYPGGKIGDATKLDLSSTEKSNISFLQGAEKIIASLPEIGELDDSLTTTKTMDNMFSLKLPAYWQQYGVCEITNGSMVFYEKLSKDCNQSYDGKLVTIKIHALDTADYPYPNYKKLGKLVDPEGKEFEIVAINVTDIRFHPMAADLYNTMSRDLQSIYNSIAPAESYTYIPY